MTINLMILCALILLVQNISGQYIGCPYSAGLLGNPFIADGISGIGLGGLGGIAPSAGGLAVTSSSPIAPTGVTVVSDMLTIEGPLAVGGQLPFMASVAVDGAVATGGQGGVSYSCGDGNIGIEGVALTPSLTLTGPIVNEVGVTRAGLTGCGRSITI